MSGHSKWSTIKRKKGAIDARRGKMFTKLIKEISIATKEGGSSDPEANPRLRLAVQNAKGANMPKDNIERAIKKASGADADSYEEVTYEGYGPNGVALLIDTLTDNKNRTTAEVRHALAKHNGNLGESGCVAWQFKTKGVIFVSSDKCDEEKLLELALEAGAEDVRDEGDGFEIVCSLSDFEDVRQAVVDAGIEYQSAEIQKIPSDLIKLDGDDARRIIKLMEVLEDLEDVQRVSANFDVPQEILQEEQ